MKTAAKTELISISQVLHLTHHRNKNQHRLSKWYKSFSQLRRQIFKLITEIECLDTAVQFDFKGKGKGEESKYVRAAHEKVEARVEFLEKRLVGKCYVAFSNLVADNQYAALGLVLMGTLARVKRVIRPLGKHEVDIQDSDLMAEQIIFPEVEAGEDDLGEVVEREEIAGISKNSVDNHGDEEDDDRVMVKKAKKKPKVDGREEDEKLSAQVTAAATIPKRHKKKRKKGDAFDDLFSSLI